MKLLTAKLQDFDLEALRSFGDLLKQRLGSGVIVLGSVIAGKVGLVSFVTSDLVKREGLHAGAIVQEVARLVGGGGGGRPDMAQAGGKDPARLDEALQGRGDDSPAPTGSLTSPHLNRWRGQITKSESIQSPS